MVDALVQHVETLLVDQEPVNKFNKELNQVSSSGFLLLTVVLFIVSNGIKLVEHEKKHKHL